MLDLQTYRSEWYKDNKNDTDRLPKDVYDQIRIRCYKNWDGMLEQLVKFTSIVFLQAEQRIIEQKTRELEAMYTIMSGTC